MTSFTSVPILTLSAIDFFSNKEILIRTPQLYYQTWRKQKLTTANFLLNLIVSIIESFVLIGFCLAFFQSSIAADAGMNMVLLLFFQSTVVHICFVLGCNSFYDNGDCCQCQNSVYCILPLSTSSSFHWY